MTAEQVQTSLRACFARWGLPQVLRVDNGDPWGTASLVPSALALWCVGLGIDVHVNPPRRCTDNGVVERDHGVTCQWCEPENCHTLAECQQRLDWACHVQREVYPALAGRTRLEAYPGLLTNPRRYTPKTEAQLWQLERVGRYLERFRFDRRVDKVGQISLFSRAYRVGRVHRGKTVSVCFSAQDWNWVVRDERGAILVHHPADDISLDAICHCRLAKRHRGA